MLKSLRRSIKRASMSWWRSGTTIFVGCSVGHVSTVQHVVGLDGTLTPLPGRSPSMHCGWCNEELPLKLESWTPSS